METILNTTGSPQAQKIIEGKLDPIPRIGENIQVGDLLFRVQDITHIISTGNVALDLEPARAYDEKQLKAAEFHVYVRKSKPLT